MRISRDVSANQLIKCLKKLGYEVRRQRGSHISLTIRINNVDHNVTVPQHDPIKFGTLSNIIKTVTSQIEMDFDEFLELLNA